MTLCNEDGVFDEDTLKESPCEGCGEPTTGGPYNYCATCTQGTPLDVARLVKALDILVDNRKHPGLSSSLERRIKLEIAYQRGYLDWKRGEPNRGTTGNYLYNDYKMGKPFYLTSQDLKIIRGL